MASDLPRVTEILRATGLIDGAASEHAMERGTAVHLACEYHDLGDLDESSLDPEVAPLCASYKRFLADTQAEIISIEEAVSCPYSGYRGHVDRTMLIRPDTRWLIDIKSGLQAPWHPIQTAAYRNCYDPEPPMHRGALYLTPTSYKLIEHTDRNDLLVFLAALRLYQWRKQWNLL